MGFPLFVYRHRNAIVGTGGLAAVAVVIYEAWRQNSFAAAMMPGGH